MALFSNSLILVSILFSSLLILLCLVKSMSQDISLIDALPLVLRVTLPFLSIVFLVSRSSVSTTISP